MTRSTSGRSLVTSAGILSLAMLVASAANYGLNLVLAQWLSPAAFGDATLMVTLMLGLTILAVGLQLVSAHLASTDTADDVHLLAVRGFLLRWAWVGGWAFAGLMLFTAPLLQSAFRTGSSMPFAILAVGLPFYLAQAVERGVLQGQLRFRRLATSYVVEAAVRLAGGLLLVLAGFGVEGATLGLTGSFVASWLVVRSHRSARRYDGAAAVAGAGALVRSTSVLLVGQIIINNGDVIVAKQMLDPGSAGRYAAVALVGRAVFFCSWAVVNAAFPLSAREDSTDRSSILRWALVTVSAMSGLAVAVIAASASAVVPVAFGDEYRQVLDLFAPYAVATGFFAVANVIATVDMARGRIDTAGVVLAGAAVQTGVLIGVGSSPQGLVAAQVFVMFGLLVVVAAVHVRPTLRARSRQSPPERRLLATV